VKTMVLVPDRRCAHALGPLLSGWPAKPPKIVTFGRETAEFLPFGFEVLAYPVEEGTGLARPFYDALVRGHDIDTVLAPAHIVSSASVPTLALDLVPEASLDDLGQTMREAPASLVEAAVATVERRATMLRLGLFVAEWRPQWFDENHRLRSTAASEITRRLTELASTGMSRAVDSDETRDTPESGISPPERSATEYRSRHRGREVILLIGNGPFEHLGPQDLAHATIIAGSSALPWLREQMGDADFVCLTEAPRSRKAADALSTSRATVVVPRGTMLARCTPRARAAVHLDDFAAGGAPTFGWSDDLTAGFFPGPDEAALALQWASWIGAGSLRIAGEPLEKESPRWRAFLDAALDQIRRRWQEPCSPEPERVASAGHSSTVPSGR